MGITSAELGLWGFSLRQTTVVAGELHGRGYRLKLVTSPVPLLFA